MSQIKIFLRDTLGLPPVSLLIGLGLATHIVLNLLLQKPVTSAYGLILPLILGLSIEGYEIWIAYREVGLLAPGNDPILIILTRHFVDVLFVLLAPIALVIFGLVSSQID